MQGQVSCQFWQSGDVKWCSFDYISDIAKVTSTDLSLEVDFTRKVLEGHVIHTVEKVDPSATHVVSGMRSSTIMLYPRQKLIQFQYDMKTWTYLTS